MDDQRQPPRPQSAGASVVRSPRRRSPPTCQRMAERLIVARVSEARRPEGGLNASLRRHSSPGEPRGLSAGRGPQSRQRPGSTRGSRVVPAFLVLTRKVASARPRSRHCPGWRSATSVRPHHRAIDANPDRGIAVLSVVNKQTRSTVRVVTLAPQTINQLQRISPRWSRR
jgi:hypothetical protein